MRDYIEITVAVGIMLGVLLAVMFVASQEYGREQRVTLIQAECFRDGGQYREFGNTAFCVDSRNHGHKILWEKEL